jgi:hypothetical protein
MPRSLDELDLPQQPHQQDRAVPTPQQKQERRPNPTQCRPRIINQLKTQPQYKEHNTMPPPTTEERAKLMDKRLAESRSRLRFQKLTQAQADIEWAINATPTGEARNALTLANIFLLHAQNTLAGRSTSTSLDDLAQPVANEGFDAAMQRAISSRTT